VLVLVVLSLIHAMVMSVRLRIRVFIAMLAVTGIELLSMLIGLIIIGWDSFFSSGAPVFRAVLRGFLGFCFAVHGGRLMMWMLRSWLCELDVPLAMYWRKIFRGFMSIVVSAFMLWMSGSIVSVCSSAYAVVIDFFFCSRLRYKLLIIWFWWKRMISCSLIVCARRVK